MTAPNWLFAKMDLVQAYQQLIYQPCCNRHPNNYCTSMGILDESTPVWSLIVPGIFQQCMEILLSGISGAFSYFDDVLIMGSTDSELDERLLNLTVQDFVLKEEDVKLKLLVSHFSAVGLMLLVYSPQGTYNSGCNNSKNKTQASNFLLTFWTTECLSSLSFTQSNHC